MLIELVCVVLAITCFFAYRRTQTLKGKLPNGPKGLPILGSVFEIDNGTIHHKLLEYAQQYGEIFRLKMLTDNVIVLNTEELIHKALSDEKYKRHFGDRPPMFFGEHFRCHNQSLAFVGDGSGYFHRTAKKSFFQALHTYGSGIQELEDNVMIEMSNLVKRIESKSGQEFECLSMMQRSLSNVISLVEYLSLALQSQELCGETIPDEDPDVNLFSENASYGDFFTNAYRNFVLSTLPFLRYLPGIYGDMFRNAKRTFNKIAQKYFHDMKKSYIPGQKRGIIDHYLEEQRKQVESGTDVFFTDERIIVQIIETVDAGMVTSWTALSNCMLVLLNYPQYQQKIQAELDKVIGKTRLPTFRDRDKCQFFQSFELELHRYLTVAPLSAPHLCKEHIELEGYDIQANSTIIPNVWYVHHNTAFWGDPWTFRPERFLNDEGELLAREHVLRRSVIPFGLGHRLCPGEMFAKTRFFLILATLLQRWSFEFPPGHHRSCDPRKKESFEFNGLLRARPFFCCAKERQ